MLDDVETIKNDFCVWKELASQWNISSRHIHRDKLYLLSDFQWILQKVVSYSSLAAIIKDGYEFVCLIILRHKSQFPFLEPKLIPGHNSWKFVIMFLESKLIKLTISQWTSTREVFLQYQLVTPSQLGVV